MAKANWTPVFEMDLDDGTHILSRERFSLAYIPCRPPLNISPTRYGIKNFVRDIRLLCTFNV